MLFAIQKSQQESKGEKAPLFGLWRVCRDNHPAKQCICGNWHAKLNRRRPYLLVRATQNKRTKLEDGCGGLRG
jgi:hypothetical protein